MFSSVKDTASEVGEARVAQKTCERQISMACKNMSAADRPILESGLAPLSCSPTVRIPEDWMLELNLAPRLCISFWSSTARCRFVTGRCIPPRSKSLRRDKHLRQGSAGQERKTGKSI